MAKKKPTPVDDTLDNAKRELFCRYYAQNDATFGNATLSYAEAYGYELGDLSRVDKVGNVIVTDECIADYKTCSSSGYRMLRNVEVQSRITVLLNELLKDDVVDSQLAKLIKQDGDFPSKIAAIREFNKLRGRIIDKSQMTHKVETFAVEDIRTILSVLPQERQDEVYAIITSAIAEAELLRSSAKIQSDSTQ